MFAGTNELVAQIGGRQPLTVEDFVRQHRDAFDLVVGTVLLIICAPLLLLLAADQLGAIRDGVSCAEDLAAYQALRDEKLATLPGVQRLTSTIVMKRIVDDRPFPVSAGRLGTG